MATFNSKWYFAISIVGLFLGSTLIAHATSTFITQQGGTGTTTPSGILYGDNGATNSLKTVTIGSNLTFSGGTLSATGGGGGIGDPFTHPAAGQSATTSLMLLNGQASTTQFSALSAYFGATATSSFSTAGVLTLTGIAGTQCLHSISGVVSGTGADCGSGSGGSGLSTTTPLSAGNLLVYSATGAGSAFGVATTTFTPNSDFSTTGTIGSFVGGANSTLSLNMATAHNWTALQTFLNSSSTKLSALQAFFGATATTTITNAGYVGIATSSPSSQLTIDGKVDANPSTPVYIATNINGSSQVLIQNSSAGTSASTGFVVCNDADAQNTGCPTYYGEFGIDGSQFTGQPHDVFVLSNYGNITNTTASSTAAFKVYTGGNPGTLRMIITGGGNIGIGTTSPQFGLAVATSTKVVTSTNGTQAFSVENSTGTNVLQTDTLNSNSPYFSTASSTGTVTFGIDKFGHQFSDGKSPTLSSCGTSPSVIGDDNNFEITVGSVSATGCTATFANAWVNAPVCTVTNQSMSVVNALTYTISTSAITLSQTGLTSAKVDVQCRQPNNSNAN